MGQAVGNQVADDPRRHFRIGQHLNCSRGIQGDVNPFLLKVTDRIRQQFGYERGQRERDLLRLPPGGDQIGILEQPLDQLPQMLRVVLGNLQLASLTGSQPASISASI
ncbi:hypothetical protein ['Paenibacillus yunnanensis' Narsing Rao et al. 2020]|uniref:hypothetical protein n=1 Tax=Paenibacillus tengchongensis TaxID=2608684 RepID=UPI00165253CD|nr:hypothetical protein [Paenibacillus tengchongensis]